MDHSANARFEALYRTHQAAVSRCVARLGVPREVWPDILQEVWITAARRLRSLEAHPCAVAWLCSVARNHAMHHCRSTARHQRKAQAIAVERSREHDDPFGERDAWDTLHRLLANSPLEQREVYLKIEVHGMSAGDVAEELGISVNTVNSRLRLTRNRLRESGPALIAALILLRARIAEAAYGDIEDRVSPRTATATTKHTGEFAARLSGISSKLALIALLVLSPSASWQREQHDLVLTASPSLRQSPESPGSVHPCLHLPWASDPPASARQVASERPPPPAPPRRAAPIRKRTLARPSPSLHDDGVDLFSDVMAAFNAKQYNKARRLAGKHRKRYPTSPFSESCELIIIRAHCKMGESRKAREMVREFSRESPNSGASRARLAQVLTRCR